MKRTILITGATGNIGAKLVSHIFTTHREDSLILLIRGKSQSEARERMKRVLAITSPEFDWDAAISRVDLCCGDITQERLGLSQSEYDRIAGRVTHIIHSAAATKFLLSLGHARQVNVEGTKNVMRLAAVASTNGNLVGVAHLSTAYVCGHREGTIPEDSIEEPRSFSNTYEQTKWEAECEVHRHDPLFPIAIFRPSIVVGDSHTGRIAALRVLYTPLRYICRGIISVLPGSPNVPLDVVPVDYVARAITGIFFDTNWGAGQTFNIVAGKDAVVTTGEVAYKALGYFATASAQTTPSRIRFVPPILFRSIAPFLSSRLKRMLVQIGAFTPYISLTRIFDNTNTLAALAGTDIVVPPLSEYLDNILAYCLETGWGKKINRAA
jgi:long-chain acyl-CoA synthetase